jgi:hypothetical protein
MIHGIEMPAHLQLLKVIHAGHAQGASFAFA